MWSRSRTRAGRRDSGRPSPPPSRRRGMGRRWRTPRGSRRRWPGHTGGGDLRVPYTQALEFFTDLQKMHVPSRLIVYERSGHWPSWHEMALYYAAHLDWFHRWLGGAVAPWDPKAIVDGAGV